MATDPNPVPTSPSLDLKNTIEKKFGANGDKIFEKAVAYDPRLDPKYDARASMGAATFAQGDSVAFKPGTGMGKSLVGHELTHVIQQRGK